MAITVKFFFIYRKTLGRWCIIKPRKFFSVRRLLVKIDLYEKYSIQALKRNHKIKINHFANNNKKKIIPRNTFCHKPLIHCEYNIQMYKGILNNFLRKPTRRRIFIYTLCSPFLYLHI